MSMKTTADIVQELRDWANVEGRGTRYGLLLETVNKLQELEAKSRDVKPILNRQQRRELARNGRLEQWMEDVYQKEHERTRNHAYRHAWVCMFIALVERFPTMMTLPLLNSIARDTIEVSRRIEPASELIDELKQKTGFDVDENPYESDIEYIEKG